jgi:hypothetical protein
MEEHCRTSVEMSGRWRDAGIPDNYTISSLVFNPACQMLVAEVRGKDARLPKRLLLRHVTADRYELIGEPDIDTAFRSPVTCEKLPVLLFNSWKLLRDAQGKRSGANWGGLYVFNLQSREMSICVSENNFNLPPPYDERGWISEILDLSDDACHAYVKVALGRHEDDGERKIIRYDYHIARLHLATRNLELISHLKNLFF